MPRDAPTFSVIVTVHRRTELVPCALFGMLRQSWPNWELIVVADGPHPVARSIVDDFRAAVPAVADRVVFFACPAAPGYWGNVARVRGLELAAGDYAAFLGHDCIALPGYLAAHAENVAREPGCLSLVDVDMWATRTSGHAEVLLPHAEYRGVLPRRGVPPDRLEIGDVDLTCMAFPTAAARKLHIFAERPERYRADYADAYRICAEAMPVLHRPGVVAGHF
jgi:glycosyltransferase involved in cell wall biosynthesis